LVEELLKKERQGENFGRARPFRLHRISARQAVRAVLLSTWNPQMAQIGGDYFL
jgi:hypothetical protein